MSEKPTEAEAQKLLDWVLSLDPAWKDRATCLQEERHVGPLQTLAILCCYTLESGNHMSVPILEQLLDGFSPAGATADCPQCGNPYDLAYPGQPYCGNTCANIARGTAAGVETVIPEEPPPARGRPRKPRDEHGNIIRELEVVR